MQQSVGGSANIALSPQELGNLRPHGDGHLHRVHLLVLPAPQDVRPQD